MDKGKPAKMRYEYDVDKNLQLSYAHGVWGGINPQGELELNFYTESDKIPPYSERIIAPDGTLGHELAPYDENLKVITRRVHSRVILNHNSACAVLEWLQDKIEDLENSETPGRFSNSALEGNQQY